MFVLQEKKQSTNSLGSGDGAKSVYIVDGNKVKPTIKKKPIQADRDVSKEFNRCVVLCIVSWPE